MLLTKAAIPNGIQTPIVQTQLPNVWISAVMITYNEERIIANALKQLAWCDEIIIVDSYSTDNTLELCHEFGCKVFTRKFEGYGNQKKFAVAQAKNDWVICIDADEVLTDKLIDEILSIDLDNTPYAGFSFPMNMFFLNKEFIHGHESGRHFLRMFNRKSGGFGESKVHESIHLNGPVKKLNGLVQHYSYYSIRQYLEKFNKYTSMSAEMAYKAGKRKSLPLALLALPFNFFKYYLLDRNFLNGFKGFVWSILSTCYHFVKFVKLKELQQSYHTTIK